MGAGCACALPLVQLYLLAILSRLEVAYCCVFFKAQREGVWMLSRVLSMLSRRKCSLSCGCCCREILILLRNSSNPQGEYIIRLIKQWVKDTGADVDVNV